MIMFNKLPYFVILQGKKYKINVDFRNMISFENKIQDKSVSNEKKIEYGLRHFYPAFFYAQKYNELVNNPQLYKEACKKIIWFYKCGREDYQKNKETGKVNKKQIYSYNYDDEYIYGAFKETYNIDLINKRMHWWKFKSLLKSLPDCTQFEKIMSYRAYEGKDKNMLELKEFWKLPKPIEEQERIDKIYEAFK